MRFLPAALSLMLAVLPAIAESAPCPPVVVSTTPEVPSGCTTLTSTIGTPHYIDPVHGSMSGDGSITHPWSRLSDVIAANLVSTAASYYNKVTKQTVLANPNGPIKPGDTVYLMSGDHGPVDIEGMQTVSGVTSLVGYNNSSPITIKAYPGNKPIVDSLLIKGGAKFIIQGITFQSLNTTGHYQTFTNHIPDVWLVDFQGTHNDIVFDSNYIQSAPTSVTLSWNMNDWLTKRSSGFRSTGGNCITITNNVISNVGFGIVSQQGNNTTIKNNVLSRIADDFIDWADNYMVIAHNSLSDSFEDGDLIHRDCIQFQPATESTVVTTVDIEYNSCIQIEQGNNPFPGNAQFISVFDGIPQNITASNNIYVGSAIDGISFYGVQTGTISNNIVVGNGSYYIPCGDLLLLGPACAASHASFFNHTPAILVQPSKAGLPASNITVTNNIASGFTIASGSTSYIFEHNLCLPLVNTNTCQIALPNGTSMVYYHSPATVGTSNVIANFDPVALFNVFDQAPTGPYYNLTLKRTNPAT